MTSTNHRLSAAAILLAATLSLLAAEEKPASAATNVPTLELPQPAHPLVWDEMEKTVDVKPADGAADFTFNVTNKSEREIEIVDVRPSCGCTLVDKPAVPWILAPGGKGSFRATVDFRGKHGKFAKAIYVISSAGTQMLGVVVNIPETDETTRLRNQELAKLDRQAVFKGDCASCHAAPLAAKTGGELFQVACGICHFAAQPAGMVPNLVIPREPRDAEYWRKWITEGKEQSLMPAFAEKHGGPLTTAQIESLVEFALANFPTQPVK